MCFITYFKCFLLLNSNSIYTLLTFNVFYYLIVMFFITYFLWFLLLNFNSIHYLF